MIFMHSVQVGFLIKMITNVGGLVAMWSGVGSL